MRWKKSLIFFFILVTPYYQGFVVGDKLRLCVVESKHTTKNIKRNCAKLNQSDSPVECVIENDRFNCLQRVAEENSDLTVLEPEDLVAATAWSEFKILVINELRFFTEEKYVYQVAALIRNNAGIQSLSDIKGKKFCHPGYEPTNDWTPALATYFENTLIEKECDPNKTSIENRVAAASKYFGAACMPGPWTTDAQLDSKLKSRYKNLCALCDSPAGCYSGDRYHGPQGALLCLTDNTGDIAWIRVGEARALFENLKLHKDEYSYLCSDGSTRAMQTEEPCFWIARPWPVIVTNSKKNGAVSDFLTSSNDKSLPWRASLVRLLENYNLEQMIPDNLGTPDDYLKRVPGFLSAYTRPSCRPSRTIQWCVSSNVEQRKCQWLSQALSVYGIEPLVSCVTRPSRMECMEAVRAQQVDLFVTTPDEDLTAREKGLKRVVHIFTNKNGDANTIAAVVKKTSKIKNVQQLKGLKACFTGYRSIGWNAFTSIMRNISGSSWDSSDLTAVSNFFKESCVAGLGKKNDTIPSNLYSLCTEDGEYGDETSAFKCLVDGGGDVAFIYLDTVTNNTGSENQRTWAHGLRESDFGSVCFDDSNSNTCTLTWTTLGSVMVHENISAVRFEEIYSTLLQMDQFFGQTYQGQTPAFLLYGTYDENHNIIFPETTQHLQSDISHVQLGRNYEQMIDDMISNRLHNDAKKLQFNSFQSCIMLAVIITVSKMIS